MYSTRFLVYLADLAHDYQSMRQFVPLSVGYLASYAYSIFGDKIEIKLFKSADKLLNAIEDRKPDLLGLSNYTWNLELTSFVGRAAKELYPNLPVIMGGPNMGVDKNDAAQFLEEREYVDVYCMFAGERIVVDIIKTLLKLPQSDRNGEALRMSKPHGCYVLNDGQISEKPNANVDKDLDFIPSPYTTHLLDEFLDEGMIPMFETTRGCPYSCSFCFWGVAALNKLTKFSLERTFADLEYVAQYGVDYSELYFADANFGILKRDVDVAMKIRSLYEENRSFGAVIVYWSKAAQPHMVDIGKALGHLTSTYVAFQSFDEEVLGAMKRKNINTDKLSHLITSLDRFTVSTQTDILVGSPRETVQSHLHSLDTAIGLGVTKINGGEIRMLPGTDMATQESRDLHGIKTKYRLFEGGMGIYRGHLVYELEETIRQTNTMTEEEMISLRVLRALFFGSVTLAEHWPLLKYLTFHDAHFTPILTNVIKKAAKHPVFKQAIDWLQQQAEEEFFNTPASIESHISNLVSHEELFGENAFLKLNFGYTARLLLNSEEHESYSLALRDTLIEKTSKFSTPEIISEILLLCRKRNYLAQCLSGTFDNEMSFDVSQPTIDALLECGYLSSATSSTGDNSITLLMDPVVAKQMQDQVLMSSTDHTYFSISQILQMFWGRCHMEPIRDAEPPRLNSRVRTTGFQLDPTPV